MLRRVRGGGPWEAPAVQAVLVEGAAVVDGQGGRGRARTRQPRGRRGWLGSRGSGRDVGEWAALRAGVCVSAR